MTNADAMGINSIVETIATKVTEDTEKFVFETIKPYCEEITKKEISKKDLERALTQYFHKEPCEDAISRQAVLAIAGDSCLDLDSYEDTKEFCDEINELPSVTPTHKHVEPTQKNNDNTLDALGDAISRDAVLGKVKELFSMGECYCDEHSITGMINELPSVTQKSGKWLNKDFRKEEFVLVGKCSVCGHVRVIDKYCANCGARMVEPQESEDKKMNVLINIPDHLYKLLKDLPSDSNEGTIENVLMKAVENGTPIPDNATNERMVGSWIKSRDSYGTNHFTCPFCEHDIATRNADNWDDNYCSNCGARMVRKAVSDDN